MFRFNRIALAVTLALPMLAGAQTNEQLKSEIEQLKVQIQELSTLVKQQANAPAPTAAPAVDPAEFRQVATKVESLIDDKETAGFKGLRISGGIDPTYITNRATGTRSFAFLNNNSDINGSGDIFTYDNSTWGLAYLDFQKEMDGGTKLRLTLAPSKSAGSAYNWGNIVHEAYASVPLNDDDKTRLLVGQFADVSGYQPWLNTYNGANSITTNQIFPGYAEYFVTKNLLFDFTNPYFYTGVGLDLVRGPWETRLYVANFDSARNGTNDCTAATSGGGNIACDNKNTHPTFIYNATYAQNEFWGFEFTGYEGKVYNPFTGGNSRLDQFEIDGNFTRGETNANAQFTVGQQQDAAYNGGKAQWWGISTLLAQRVLPKLTLAARLDYLNNQRNGGGTFATQSAIPSTIDNGASNYVGDFYNGFGPGDPNAAGYDPNKGANRSALSLSATYRLNPNVALRAEFRYDYATTPSFYYYDDQSFRKSNQVFGLQSIINF